MQQINTERPQTSFRLPRQLPANINKEITSPIRHKHINKISKSAPNRFDKLTSENRQQLPLRRLQTDLDNFDTHRSLSSCPTYSSLSRHSPETRECATQITTLTPTQTVENNQEISNDSSSPIDNNQVLLVDEIPVEEIELMPISSGFGNYPYNYPTTMTERVVAPQIVSRAPKFRDNQRDKNQTSPNSNSKLKPTKKSPPRPTAVKQAPYSDTVTLPTKRNEINPKISKSKPTQNDSRRLPLKEPVVKNSVPAPPEKNRAERMHGNGVPRRVSKHLSPPLDQDEFGRKPIRFANKHNREYQHSSPPASYEKPSPAFYEKTPPSSEDASDRQRHMRIGHSDYVIRRRRQPPDYVYDDYRTETPPERRRPQRLVRVRRDVPYEEEDDDVYYVERPSPRRIPVVRRPPPREYVYVDDTPPRRHRRPHHPEVVYINEDRPRDYEDDYIYVDEDGNEVDFIDEPKHSPRRVEYLYDDDDERRSHKPKVIYVEDEPPINQERIRKKSKQPSSTRIIYE